MRKKFTVKINACKNTNYNMDYLVCIKSSVPILEANPISGRKKTSKNVHNGLSQHKVMTDYFGMSSNPLDPKGFNYWFGETEPNVPGIGRMVSFEEVPTEVKQAILLRLEI